MGNARWVLKRISDAQEVDVLSNLTVGRADDSGLKLREPGASKHHAELDLVDGDLFITDLGSTNGTFVNDVLLDARIRTQIRAGDRIRFDREEFEARIVVATEQAVDDVTQFGEARSKNVLGGSVLRPPTQASPARAAALPSAFEDDGPPGGWKLKHHLGIQTKIQTKLRVPTRPNPTMLAGDAARDVHFPHLYVSSGRRKGQRIRLTPGNTREGTWTIGARADQTIKFEDDGVSSRHAQLRTDGRRWVLTDSFSGNGIFVNGKRVYAHWLNDGDRVQLGPVKFVFHRPREIALGSAPLSVWSAIEKILPKSRSLPGNPIPEQDDNVLQLRAPQPLTEEFKYSVTAPRSVRAGESFLLEIWAHLVADTREVIARAIESSIDRDIVIRSVASQAAPAGSIVDVQVQIPDFAVDQKLSIRWTETIGNAGFMISVPLGSQSKPHAGFAKLFVGDFNIGLLEFSIVVSDQHLAAAEVTQAVKRVTSGFASYAEDDQEQVMARVQGILSAVPDLDLFLDVATLRHKPSWATDTKVEIAGRDAFYLFWSQAASQSKWVEHEWRTALAVKGLEMISPVPLVDPAVLFPPAELAAIPFKRWVSPKPKPIVAKRTGSDELPNNYALGKYKISELISRGGFGVTYKAIDEKLRRDIAIKEYFPVAYAYRGADFSVQPRAESEELFKWGLQRFLDEARALAMFKHDNILRVYDHFEANSTAYLGTDLEVGKTLESILREDAPIKERRLREDILVPILNGLAEVHARGLLHRDIKPENIIIRDSDGKAVLIDFGASRLTATPTPDGSMQRLTSVITRGYSPIEQSLGREQGAYTDIYALSATIYRAIAGEPPPDAPARLRGVGLADIRRFRDRYGTDLLNATLQGLCIEPAGRPQSVQAFQSLLGESAHSAWSWRRLIPSRPILIGLIAFAATVLAGLLFVLARHVDR